MCCGQMIVTFSVLHLYILSFVFLDGHDVDWKTGGHKGSVYWPRGGNCPASESRQPFHWPQVLFIPATHKYKYIFLIFPRSFVVPYMMRWGRFWNFSWCRYECDKLQILVLATIPLTSSALYSCYINIFIHFPHNYQAVFVVPWHGMRQMLEY